MNCGGDNLFEVEVAVTSSSVTGKGCARRFVADDVGCSCVTGVWSMNQGATEDQGTSGMNLGFPEFHVNEMVSAGLH